MVSPGSLSPPHKGPGVVGGWWVRYGGGMVGFSRASGSLSEGLTWSLKPKQGGGGHCVVRRGVNAQGAAVDKSLHSRVRQVQFEDWLCH